MNNSIKSSVLDNKIGVAFSGGVDSTLLAKLCHSLNYDLVLLTIGFANSHDIKFAQEVNTSLKLKHEILEIDQASFEDISKTIRQQINTENLSWNENCIAFYYISKLASSLNLHTVVTANGIDELFCGYDRYRTVVSDGYLAIQELMNSKLDNEIRMMKAVNHVCSTNAVTVVQPFLAREFIEYAKTIPLSDKICGEDDFVRKHIIRKLAQQIGVPESAYLKRKKALQYGSGIHKKLIKMR